MLGRGTGPAALFQIALCCRRASAPYMARARPIGSRLEVFMTARRLGLGGVALSLGLTGLFGLTGCAASLAQPFDTLKRDQAPMTVFRLQNFEPPQATAAAPAAGGFQLPPQIQQWVTAGAAMLPPGLLPPGLLPGTQAPPAQAQAPRFHEFRILGSVNVADTAVHKDMMELLGNEANFENPRESCMYAEFGIAVSQLNQPPADVLVSLSCSQVRSFGFVWPHGTKTGLKPETVKKMSDVMRRAFGG